MKSLDLKYGMNPHQKQAVLYLENGTLPLEVYNGKLSYINILDALNSWQLVKELKETLNMPAAASFKHVSPAGAAVGVPLTNNLKKVYFVDEVELTPLATAYVRARGADRMSSFGDWVALSDMVDGVTARVLKKEVSDGIIAPGYTDEALEILKKKKRGQYKIIKIDYNYEPDQKETRMVYGITLEQQRNRMIPNLDDFTNIVTDNKVISEDKQRDLLVAMITLKYTQSNSICYAVDGQVIGCGSGQQSRIHCTRLAGDKADTWYLRQHPTVLNLNFRKGIGRAERDNAIDLFLLEKLTKKEQESWEKSFIKVPRKLTSKEKKEWLSNMKEVSLASDGFIPFRDNIDRAVQSGVKYIIQPGGSIRDEGVINACNEYGLVMILSNLRLFHH